MVDRIGLPMPPDQRAEYGPQVAAIRAAIGDAAFEAAFREGRRMGWEDAAALALGPADLAGADLQM